MGGSLKNHYIYIVFRPNGEPLYVGKGTGARWKRHAARARSNPHYAAILNQAGGELSVACFAHGLGEAEAFALERLLTEMIGIEADGGPLVNCGHGGRGGPAGVKRSDEWRATRRLRAIEAWRDETYRAKVLRADRERSGNKQPRTTEFKTAMSERLRGNTHTLGLRHTSEARAKMSLAGKGRPKSDEHRAKIGAANKIAWIERRKRAGN